MKGVVVVGSNSADRKNFIKKALLFLSELGKIESCSTIYESPDILGRGNKYLNAVVQIDFKVTEKKLHERIKNFESHCGRDHSPQGSSVVPLDIDIVIWQGVVLRPKDFNSTYFQIGYRQIFKPLSTVEIKPV